MFQGATQADTLNWNKSFDWVVNGESGMPVCNECSGEQVDTSVLPLFVFQLEGSWALLDQKYQTETHPLAAVSSPWFRNTNVIEFHHSFEAGAVRTIFYIRPYKLNINQQLELIMNLNLTLVSEKDPIPTNQPLNKKKISHSVLASGTWHKLWVSGNDLYKIDFDLASKMGLTGNTPLSKVGVFANGGALLPEPISESRPEDLLQLAVYVKDFNLNDRWDNGDYMIFYARGTHNWVYNESIGDYEFIYHPYSDVTACYVTVLENNGKRIQQLAHRNDQSALIEIDRYDYLLHREFSDENVLKSGRDWYRELFRSTNEIHFTEDLPNPDLSLPVQFRSRMAARSTGSSFLSIKINGQDALGKSFYQISGEYDKDYMTAPAIEKASLNLNTPNIDIHFNYQKPNQSSYVYLDWYEIRSVSLLKWEGSTRFFGKSGTGLMGNIRYKIDAQPPMIWDITDISEPKWHESAAYQSGFAFTADAGGKVRSYVMFNPDLVIAKPGYIGQIANQDLHGLKDIEYLIVSHPSLLDQAARLAEFHQNKEGFTYKIVTPEEIYNEFSSGTPDITAIRDFVAYLYAQNNTASRKLKYLLLMGDASFDYRDKTNGNTNLIPTYQSVNSFQPAYSYCSDDYYAILDPTEGNWGIKLAKEGLDIGIGRIPATNDNEARIMVDKIVRYHDSRSLGDWRNQITFLGDDEDQNTHFEDVESVTNYIYNQAPVYNINKIYLDAFKQEVFGSGQKYPGVNEAINQSFDRGHLIFNFLGHGGQSGMTHERVVTRPQILNWQNTWKLPLVVTATCELSRFDDPAQASPGELALFNEYGGGIAMITTSRLVFIGLNKDLNVAIFNRNIFEKIEGRWPTLGEVYSLSKNNSARAENQRNFILMGDPAMTLAYPEYAAKITEVNQQPIEIVEDTLQALASVSISGEVTDLSGNRLSNFEGTAYPTVYDKFLNYTTLGNDVASQAADYSLQNSVLYRGKVSVKEGKFSFSFVVPKDIAYQYGKGKLSLYAENGKQDASGYYSEFYVGGSSDQIVPDSSGPSVELYMDDVSFRFGDMVSPAPLLLAHVFDFNGVNTVGNGIGRDITAILDKGTENEKLYILNEYYQSELDSYQKGEIRFPFEQLSEGKHSVHLKIWDVYNNSTGAYTEFVVGNAVEAEILQLQGFPNPSDGNFEIFINHNLAGEPVQLNLYISDLSGKILYETRNHYDAADARIYVKPEFRLALNAGMYFIRAELVGNEGQVAQKVSKIIVR